MDIQIVSDSELKKIAGQGAFQRGRDYFKSGHVLEWAKKRNKIIGTVEGNDTYQVTLTYSASGLDGCCDCPASDGFDFCKHCVALALQYNQALAEDQAQEEKLSKIKKGSQKQKIQAYLESLEKSELSRQLMQLIMDDPQLKQEWSIKADVALGYVDAKSLKKRITAALPLKRRLYRYPQVRSYFAKLEPVIELLQQQAEALDPQTVLQLIDYGLTRIDQALETIDDSGGFRLAAMEALQQLHVDVLERMEWKPDKKAEYLYQLTKSEIAFYPPIPDAYHDALGKEGLERFLLYAKRDWQALPKLDAGAGLEQKYDYYYLQRLLSAQAQAEGDFPALIEIVAKTAVNGRDFLNICELCIQENQWREAEKWLHKAESETRETDTARAGRQIRIRRPEFGRSLRLQELAKTIHVHFKRFEQALDIQWQLFTDNPELSNYTALLELEQRTGASEMADKARKFLIEKLEQENDSRYFRSGYSDDLLKIYLHENDLADAEALVQKQQVSPKSILNLARKLSATPAKALPMYERVVRHLIQQMGNDNYRQAVRLLTELRDIAKQPEDKQRFNALLSSLRSEFKAKRNFISYLAEAFNKTTS